MNPGTAELLFNAAANQGFSVFLLLCGFALIWRHFNARDAELRAELKQVRETLQQKNDEWSKELRQLATTQSVQLDATRKVIHENTLLLQNMKPLLERLANS